MSYAEQDTDNPILKAFGSLQLSLSKNTERLEAIERTQRQAFIAEQPRFVRIHGVVTHPASGVAVVDLDNNGPDPGFIWYLRKLYVGGIGVSTVAAGRADLFVSSLDYRTFNGQALGNLGVFDYVDTASTLPLIGDFGAGEVPIQSPEALWVVFSGGTSGQQYAVSGVIQQFQLSASRQDWAK